jgi:hypothetical protein
MMRSSDIEQWISTINCKNVVAMIMQGRDYGRAVRAHFLLHSALVNLLMSFILNTSFEDSIRAVNLTEPYCISDYQLNLADICKVQQLYQSVSTKKVWMSPGKSN